MIRTVDKAVEVLNAKRHDGLSWFYDSGSQDFHGYDGESSRPLYVLRELDGIAIARSLNGDYEALEAENASLSSKLERARMELWLTKNNLENVALEAALIGKPMPLEVLQDWVSQGIKSVSTALAETEEENLSGDNGESVQS